MCLSLLQSVWNTPLSTLCIQSNRTRLAWCFSINKGATKAEQINKYICITGWGWLTLKTRLSLCIFLHFYPDKYVLKWFFYLNLQPAQLFLFLAVNNIRPVRWSYYSLQVLQQVVGDNPQTLDLCDQIHKLVARMTTHFRRAVPVDLCAARTCRKSHEVVCSALGWSAQRDAGVWFTCAHGRCTQGD